MADRNDPGPHRVKDGYTVSQKGHTPTKVQGGYVPTASGVTAKPPSGGSGAKPPRK
jgi:hypothetical protein